MAYYRYSVLFLALSALCAAAPAVSAEENQTQKSDPQIEQCLADARQQAPDLSAHGKRMLLANQCICAKAPKLCVGGMIQNDLLRQRLLDDK